MNSEFVRVPFYVEKNGQKTHFLPACRMSKGYRIGLKGEEQMIEDYWQALSVVSAMKVPRFRRPNAQGNFGIVACEAGDFEEVSRSAIEEQISARLSNTGEQG